MAFLDEQITAVERGLDKLLRPDPRVAWLTTLPGVGRLTAYFILSEIGAIAHFMRPAKSVSYCGLCPSTHQSASRVRRGSTSGSGRRLLKWALVEAAHTAVRRDALWGGVNGFLTVEMGSEEDVVQAVREAIDALAPGGGFILSPVDNVRDDSPKAWENVRVLVETSHELGWYH